MVGPGAVFELPRQGETHEVLATPEETGDRYRVRSTFAPHAKGPSTHVHPGIVERFEIVSGTMNVRIGREHRELREGDKAEVPLRVAHRLWSTSDEPAVMMADLVIPPPGPRPETDILKVLETTAGLIREGKVNPRNVSHGCCRAR